MGRVSRTRVIWVSPAAKVEAVVHGARRHRQRRLREARAGRAEELALHEPPQRRAPGGEDGDRPAAAGHDSADPARRSAPSNASRSSSDSTTTETLDG